VKNKVNAKRFVRYKEGAELYSMCQTKFEEIAKEAGAVYKLNKLVLVNCDILDDYLETFRMMPYQT
jgi:conserved domain protein